MEISDWDRRIAPFLREIEDRSRRIYADTKNIAVAVAALPYRPEWETKANDNMETAITALEDLRSAVADKIRALREVQQIYEDKPTDECPRT